MQCSTRTLHLFTRTFPVLRHTQDDPYRECASLEVKRTKSNRHTGSAAGLKTIRIIGAARGVVGGQVLGGVARKHREDPGTPARTLAGPLGNAAGLRARGGVGGGGQGVAVRGGRARVEAGVARALGGRARVECAAASALALWGVTGWKKKLVRMEENTYASVGFRGMRSREAQRQKADIDADSRTKGAREREGEIPYAEMASILAQRVKGGRGGEGGRENATYVVHDAGVAVRSGNRRVLCGALAARHSRIAALGEVHTARCVGAQRSRGRARGSEVARRQSVGALCGVGARENARVRGIPAVRGCFVERG